MTTADMVAYLGSTVDEFLSPTGSFYTTADIYIALNAGQRLVLTDAVGGESKDWRAVRNLVVSESLADGASLSNQCFLPLAALDTTAQTFVPIKTREECNAYSGVTLTGFMQCFIDGGKLHTFPAGGTLTVSYIRFPAVITSSQNPELDEVYHVAIVSAARGVLIRKDISTPLHEQIESDTNREIVFKTKEQPAEGYQPRPLPYSR